MSADKQIHRDATFAPHLSKKSIKSDNLNFRNSLSLHVYGPQLDIRHLLAVYLLSLIMMYEGREGGGGGSINSIFIFETFLSMVQFFSNFVIYRCG